MPAWILNMQRFWPSHLALKKCSDSGLRTSTGHPRATLGRPRCLKQHFFQEASLLNNYFFEAFLPSSTWPRDTVNMQGLEPVAISEATSELQNFFEGPLRAPKEPSELHVGLRNPWETASPSARQIDCIFAMDYEQKCLRGL